MQRGCCATDRGVRQQVAGLTRVRGTFYCKVWVSAAGPRPAGRWAGGGTALVAHQIKKHHIIKDHGGKPRLSFSCLEITPNVRRTGKLIGGMSEYSKRGFSVMKRAERAGGGGCLRRCRLGGRAIWPRRPVLDLMDGTKCRLFSLVTLKSLSLLHDRADFYGPLRQSAACSLARLAS